MEPQRRMEGPPGRHEDGDGEPELRLGVGEILRRKRESYGQDLTTVAAQLHIRLAYLQAVEAGRFKDLPGMAYASGFVRSYGDYLGLDGEELVRLFREEVAGIDRQVRLSAPIVASEGRIPGGAVLLLSGLLAVMAYGAWYYLSDRHKSFADIVPEVPSQLRAVLGKEAPPNAAATPPVVRTAGGAGKEPVNRAPTVQPAGAAPGSGAPGGGAGDTGRSSQMPAGTELSSSSASAPAEAAPAAPTISQASLAPAEPIAPPPPPATSVLADAGDLAPLPAEFSAMLAAAHPAADGAAADAAPLRPPVRVMMASPGARVELVAHMDSWVQINDKTGKTYYSAVLRAGQAVEVPNQPGLLLTTGNAGGLQVLVDGQPVPPLGAVGLVRRDIALDPAGLKSAVAAH